MYFITVRERFLTDILLSLFFPVLLFSATSGIQGNILIVSTQDNIYWGPGNVF